MTEPPNELYMFVEPDGNWVFGRVAFSLKEAKEDARTMNKYKKVEIIKYVRVQKCL